MGGESSKAERANFRQGCLVFISKFMIVFFEAGITKSFGVLIPSMVEKLGASHATVGLICSLPATLLCLVGEYLEARAVPTLFDHIDIYSSLCGSHL